MNRQEQAVQIKHARNNCCQAVLLAYADKLPFDEPTLRAMGAAFGGGMSTGEATCGALCGAQMVLGLMEAGKRPVAGNARAVLTRFRELCGATICADLKGTATGKMLCSCDDCVRNAVRALEETLQ